MSEALAVAVPGHELVPPHGGRLVWRIPEKKVGSEYQRQALKCQRIVLDPALQSDLLLIATGAYSPLQGFMGEEDYLSVLEKMRLSTQIPWSLPVVLPVREDEARRITVGDRVTLTDEQGQALGLLDVTDKYSRDKRREMLAVFKTEDITHPGVSRLKKQEDTLLGGPIWLIRRPPSSFADYERDPAEVQEIISARNWKSVVGFQTRNPLHRGHEYLIKCALEIYDGILLHPLVGATRREDIPPSVRMACYSAVLEHYLPSERIILAAFPASMRYAGPREAIFHALVRKNYGCTHFIVGRDHAGVNGFYAPDAAQKIFLTSGLDLGIEPLFFDSVFYCSQCGTMASERTCPHDSKVRVFPSGTELRQALRTGRKVPHELNRPEVTQILQEFYERQQVAS